MNPELVNTERDNTERVNTELGALTIAVDRRVKEPQWEGAVVAGKYIYIAFHGQFTTEAGKSSARWVDGLVGSKDFSLIFDTRAIAGYESGARKAWEEILFPKRKNIQELVLLATSTVAIMGATMFGLVMGIKVRHIKDLNAL